MKSVQQSHSALAAALGIPSIYLKRDDTHPYGSHKGRAIPQMIKEYRKKDGVQHFVISSSGNAALAAAITVAKHNTNNPDEPLTLRIFVGKHIAPGKLDHLQEYVDERHITLQQVENPKQQAFQLDKAGEAKNLRQSTDELAVQYYLSLAQEVSKIPNLQAIFIPTSSGTTAQGVAEAFHQLSLPIQVHMVQTSACHTLVDGMDPNPPANTDTSLAGAIVDRVGHRKSAAQAAVQKTNGGGWIVNDAQITAAQELITQHTHIDTSPNSALSVAGLQKALASGWTCTGPVICLLTGK